MSTANTASAGHSAHLGRVGVVIPAYNEEHALARLLPILRRLPLRQIIVADNGSCDRTSDVVRRHGCELVCERRRGYGAACAAALAALADDCDIVVFLDADLADDPTRLAELVGPVAAGQADLVIGCRDGAPREEGALNAAQRFGHGLATTPSKLPWGVSCRALGPFRAIRRSALTAMNMRDRAFGWTVEMQVRALQMGLRIAQVAVPYRRRVGKSKISGTLRGVLLAGYYILTTIARLCFATRV